MKKKLAVLTVLIVVFAILATCYLPLVPDSFAAGDFNKPSGSSARSTFMTEIRDMFADQAKLFNGTSTLNYPANAVRYNGTSYKFQKYNGATWDDLTLSGQTVGTATNANNLYDGTAYRSASQAPGANQIIVLNTSGDLNLTASSAGDIYIKNGKRIYAKDSVGNDRYVFSLDVGDNFNVGTTVHPTYVSSSADPMYYNGTNHRILHVDNSGTYLTAAASGFAIGGNTAWHAGNAITGELTGSASTIDCGTVTAGDILYVQYVNELTQASGNSEGNLFVGKNSGTATILTATGKTLIGTMWKMDNTLRGSNAATQHLSGIIKVTGTGTLVLGYSAVSYGTAPSYGTSGWLIYFLKKQ